MVLKKTPQSWSIKKRRSYESFSYTGESVELNNDESFELAKTFDAVFWGEHVLALREKSKFESVFKYKEAHIESFSELCAEPEFLDIFSDVGPLSNYVNNNKMQLRRAAAIQQKGYYRDHAFIESLRRNIDRLQLDINFGDDGKIYPCEMTCPDIFKALLEHRLLSHYQDRPFDVPDAVLKSPG
ncbi:MULTISPECIES: Kiwa anti-phage protein KwaB-like domain-containing protein [unclassified Halomonas]|uniref:Kiwa anti-phage protein KwaB-like domain-containing protein n=1 Tax=unclassified Halomonas TaxID=2609666 RepID=UPI001CF4A970|nr:MULTISPECIES: Kiwa anti-phage protein KwaB-like domain-containing protein [unclassified Halomonas]MCA8865587.1 DUF4868 domain-containing protein [Halomonas sp. SBBP1]UZH10445.1 DUF4868 domain-containing protein [Halomonas sp. BDJS001]